MKIGTDDSATSFKHVNNSYVAPECENMDEQEYEQKSVIGRASDVWSLGCIMLEIMVLMAFGSAQLKKFVQERAYTIHRTTFRRFHKGPGIKHPVVEAQLTRLEQKIKNFNAEKTIALIRKMLHLEPDMRPKSGSVAVRMQFIVLELYSRNISGLFDAILTRDKSTSVYIEHRRFHGWLRIWESDITASDQEMETAHRQDVSLNFNYQTGLSILQKLKNWLDPLTARFEELILGIRVCNDELLDLLSDKARHGIYSYLTSSLLSRRDQNILDELSHSQSSLKSAVDIRKALTDLGRGQGNLSRDMYEIDIHGERFRELESFDNHKVGALQSQEHSGSANYLPVIVETKGFPEQEISEPDLNELKYRLQEVTQILKEVNRSGHSELPILECCGYFFDRMERKERGLVYKFPMLHGAHAKLKVQTLNSIMTNRPGSIKNLPTLSDRFTLARSLAKFVLKFHQACWLQKSISSHNIIFFIPEHSNFLKDETTRQPHFLGYISSRQARPDAFTEGPKDRTTSDFDYQHPEYAKGQKSLKLEYDYYSLGIVLLEIAFWRPLHKMSAFSASKTPDLAKVRKSLLENELTQTPAFMGNIFHDVVRRCLNGDFQIPEVISAGEDGREVEEGYTDSGIQTLIQFEKLVVESLQKCLV
ncbi:MAG: hypothetical protein Q9227_003346 [Pyrenula ochraceoflavens]